MAQDAPSSRRPLRLTSESRPFGSEPLLQTETSRFQYPNQSGSSVENFPDTWCDESKPDHLCNSDIQSILDGAMMIC